MPKKKKKNKESGINLPEKYNKKTLRRFLSIIFRNNATRSFNYKQLAKKLMVNDSATKQLITEVCYQLKEEGKINELYTGKFKHVPQTSMVEGIIDLTSSGKAYLMVDDFEDDAFISTSNLNHALHGDTVRAQLFATRRGRGVEAEVIEILHRGKKQFVGTVEISQSFAFLVPDGRNMPYDIFIPLEKLNGAKNGYKAIAIIAEWPARAKNPVGEIIDVLGKSGENDTEMHAILAEFDLPHRFPENIDKEAEKISDKITENDLQDRRDMRNVTTFTIDPEDAKDFDDALSLAKLDNGLFEVGIHIADVTHYVDQNDKIDAEAYSRGTSVYLVDRVVPMLPERLSNFICSLRPNEDKLTYSAIFTMDENANVKDEWFGRTIINSDKRFTYEQAQEIIETGQGDLKDEVLLLNNMAQTLRKHRFKDGAIGFERVETKFRLDDKGAPLDVYFKESKDANKLIEEFMLLANKRVAEFVGKPKSGKTPKTFVYRVHDEPDLERLSNFSRYIKRWGYSLNMQNNAGISASLNNLLKTISGKPEEDVISNLAVRAMAKAVYSVDNIGHYGLAFQHYTHFTSPIRRYPDMMVHRLLTLYLNNKPSANQDDYKTKCKHTSDMERRAAMAERTSIKYKQAEFMQSKLGQVFDGVVSGITEWGIYVEIVENKIEGMIPLHELTDDHYIYDDKNYTLVGKYKGLKYALGDKLKIQLIRVNLIRKQIDFIPYTDN